MRHKEQIAKRVRKADYKWGEKDRCLLCGKSWLRACSSHSIADNLSVLQLIRHEDGR